MKKGEVEKEELRSEYCREDFSTLVRGKHAARCRESSNVVVIDPEVQKVFPNTQAVNAALRGLMESSQEAGPAKRSPSSPRKRAAG